MLYQTMFPMANWIGISNNFNNQYFSILDEEQTFIDETNVCFTEVKPVLYNLPDDKYTRKDVYAFEEGRYSCVPLSVRRFLQGLPLKWLSQITSKYGENYEDILIINDCNLPDSIKQYVKSYYVRFCKYSDETKNKFSSIIHSNIEKDSREYSLSDYLKALDKQNVNNFYVGSWINYYNDDIWYHIFDGITLDDFYKIYFKSGLSKEVILRYLKDTEFTYSIDNQVIEKEVERILNKH